MTDKAKAPEKVEAKAPEKVEAKGNFKKEYTVCVTGFLAFGKMFRANKKISSKTYADHINKWLKEGKIK